jgi:hypothetical protein
MQLTVDPARFSRIKLWILVPAGNDLIHSTFAVCLTNLIKTLRQYSVHADLIFMPGDSLVTRARNNLADMFMGASSDSNDHFALWLDYDILFDPMSVIQLLALDLDFVAAPYSKKGLHMDRMAEAARLGWPSERIRSVAGTPNVNWITAPIQIGEPMPVLEAGSGFWLMKRKVLEQMQAAYPELRYNRAHEEKAHYGRDHGWDYFKVGIWPETGEYLSEDWWFSRTWHKLGGTLFCCFWIKTHHIGPHMYSMDMPAIAELLDATGGYINGPTRTEEKSNAAIREETQANRAAQPGANGDISRAIAFALGGGSLSSKTDQAAVEGNPGALGG